MQSHLGRTWDLMIAHDAKALFHAAQRTIVLRPPKTQIQVRFLSGAPVDGFVETQNTSSPRSSIGERERDEVKLASQLQYANLFNPGVVVHEVIARLP